MPEIFDQTCEPVNIGNCKLNCLLYADDVVLLSESKYGLQNCLDRLEDYCNNWCLGVNFSKTKVLIFNKSGKLINDKFLLNGVEIQNVQNYKYLGLVFSVSGSFTQAQKDLYNRGLKAFFQT